jgi:hypothetical protein
MVTMQLNGGNVMKQFVLLFVALALAATTYGAPFSDVPRTHWAYDAIQKAVNAGILQGYDGKYDGQRLLNRYQMAVIVAKMLDKMGTGGGAAAAPEDLKKMIANLEALTVEFADELALLNVKVSTLEDTVKELQAGKGPVKVANVQAGEIGFTAFAAFALLVTDKVAGANRYGGADTMLFDMPQVSIGVDKEVNPGVYFHAQFDWASDLNVAPATMINQAYFFVDELIGDIGGKVGAFAPPFSMEHNGPFRTCNLTIQPSLANTLFDAWRFTGLELQRTKDVKPGDILFKFGIVSGSDTANFGVVQLNDAPVPINRAEVDDGFGFYLWIGKKPARSGQFGWNLSFYDNGGDTGATAPAIATVETDFVQLGFEWSNKDFLVMFQYLDGNNDPTALANDDVDWTMFYLLVNFKIDEKQSITLRYDDIEAQVNVAGAASADGDAITFAWNRQVTDNSILQFEYASFDSDTFWAAVPVGGVALADVDDDLIQLRYKVHF